MQPIADLRTLLTHKSRSEAEAALRDRTRSTYLGKGCLLSQVFGKYKFFVLSDDVGFAPHILFDGFWEFWLTKFMAEKISAGDTTIDIGANVGYYSLEMADLVGAEGRVFYVEPNKVLFDLASKSLSVNGFGGRVFGENVALSDVDEAGFAQFFVPTGEPKNGRLLADAERAEHLGTLGSVFDVRIDRLDIERFDRVDFIKIDVEGAEIAVLRSLRQLIERFEPQIVCEMNFSRGYDYDAAVSHMGVDGELFHLDYDATVMPLTREMVATDRLGDDWLVYNRAQ